MQVYLDIVVAQRGKYSKVSLLEMAQKECEQARKETRIRLHVYIPNRIYLLFV